MTTTQLDHVTELLRNSPLDLGDDVKMTRTVFEEMIGGRPVPDDVRTRAVSLGGVAALEVIAGSGPADGTLLYFHGGAYVVGSAASSVNLVPDIARRTGADAFTVDYRLAPENPFPAAIDDAVAAYKALIEQGVGTESIALVGESAGGGLALALLVAIEDAGLPQPSAAVVLSPWVDLTQSGPSMETRAEQDPSLTRQALQTRARDYLAGADPRNPLASPLHADLRGLPPLLVQVGSSEILLDDALRIASKAAHADVSVTLQTFSCAPHVFQGFAPGLDAADAALDQVALFLRRHLR
jgi:monoterpene epsilon-lactone hydrolase